MNGEGTEIDRLRHDIERMQEIDSKHLAEIDRLRAENAELRGALHEYGQHREGCEDEVWHGKGPQYCGCGLNAILAKTAKEEK